MRFATLLYAIGILAMPAMGRVKEADNNIVSNATDGVIAAIPVSGPSLPRALATNRDVYVLIGAGAAYTEVTVLGPRGTSGRKLAQALDAAFPGSHGATVYTNDEDYAAAYASAPNGHFFAQSSHADSPAGRIVAGIRAAGYTPHALLRAPRYAQVSATLDESQGTKRFHWYDVSACPATTVVSVEAHLTRAEWYWAMVADLFPFLAIVLNLTGIAIALVKRIPLDTRIIWYKRLGWRSTIGVMMVTGVLFLCFLPSETAVPVADIWAGASTVGGLTPHSLLAIPMLLVLTIPVMLLHKPLLGEPEDPDLIVAELGEDEKAVRKRITWYTFAVCLLGLAVYSGSRQMPRREPTREFVQFGAIALMLFSHDIVQRLYRKQLAPFEKKDPDAGLTRRASSIAPAGKRVTEVRVDDGQCGRSGAYASGQRDGSVLVSRVLADGFTPEEFDFAVAQAAAQGPYQYRLLLRTVPLALAGSAWPAFWLFSPLRHHVQLEPQARMLVIMGPWMAILLGGGYLFTLSIKRGFARADRAALAMTHNLPAAQSALQKMHTTGGRPYTEAKADPKLAWRLNALQRAARELGITG